MPARVIGFNGAPTSTPACLNATFACESGRRLVLRSKNLQRFQHGFYARDFVRAEQIRLAERRQ